MDVFQTLLFLLLLTTTNGEPSGLLYDTTFKWLKGKATLDQTLTEIETKEGGRNRETRAEIFKMFKDYVTMYDQSKAKWTSDTRLNIEGSQKMATKYKVVVLVKEEAQILVFSSILKILDEKFQGKMRFEDLDLSFEFDKLGDNSNTEDQFDHILEVRVKNLRQDRLLKVNLNQEISEKVENFLKENVFGNESGCDLGSFQAKKKYQIIANSNTVTDKNDSRSKNIGKFHQIFTNLISVFEPIFKVKISESTPKFTIQNTSLRSLDNIKLKLRVSETGKEVNFKKIIPQKNRILSFTSLLNPYKKADSFLTYPKLSLQPLEEIEFEASSLDTPLTSIELKVYSSQGDLLFSTSRSKHKVHLYLVVFILFLGLLVVLGLWSIKKRTEKERRFANLRAWSSEMLFLE